MVTIAAGREGASITTEAGGRAGCPVAQTARIIGNRWTPLIVRDLAGGCRRFSELERSLGGISPKTLSERLKRMEESGIVLRHCFAEVPPRVEYALTQKGLALLPIIEDMRSYGERWLGTQCVGGDALPGLETVPAVA